MKHVKHIITSIALAIMTLGVPLVMIGQANALFEGAAGQATCGANLQDPKGTAGCTDTTNSEQTINGTLKSVINILSFVVGIICVIMIIIGGLRYVTSGGDGTSTSSARNTVLYAVIGLVVVIMAQVIVKFVLGKAAK